MRGGMTHVGNKRDTSTLVSCPLSTTNVAAIDEVETPEGTRVHDLTTALVDLTVTSSYR